ncbi:MAG: TrbI/VirB10 family protein [Bdellovibrionales bacterium]|nr:TrbI/VirB10 family protein [Bdellovibrionales bacterium]
MSNWILELCTDKQLPSSQKPSLSKERILKLGTITMIVFAVGIGFAMLLTRCTRQETPKDSSQPAEETAANQKTDGEQEAHILYFANAKPGGIGNPSLNAKAKGTLVRVRLLNSLETFETVPAFAQIVDYSLGKTKFGATLIGDASGDSSVERIKIRFNTLKPKGDAKTAIQLDGQALSLDGTLGVKAEKLEGLMVRAVTASAHSGASGIGGLGGGKGDLNQFLLKALLSGLQSELSGDLSAERNRENALGLKPGVEFLVQLLSDFGEAR